MMSQGQSSILTFPLLDKNIIDAVQKYVYTQQQISTHRDMHHSTISNLMRGDLQGQILRIDKVHFLR
jgi:hypothetical protein